MQIGIYEALPGTMLPHHHNATADGDFIFCDLRSFGAVLDGVADDTVAIQNALTWAEGYTGRGKLIWANSGIGLISSTLLMNADSTFCGGGLKNRLVIKLADGSNCDMLRNVGYGAAAGREGIQIENIEFDGNKAGQAGVSHGLNFQSTNFVYLKNVTIHDCLNDGIRVLQLFAGGILYTNAFIADNLYSGSNGGNGAYFDNCPVFSLFRPVFEFNGIHGLHIKDILAEGLQVRANTTLIHPHIEGNVSHGIYLESGAHVNIYSPMFYGGALQAAASRPLKIGAAFYFTSIYYPTFTGATPTWDIEIENGAMHVDLIGGLNADRAAYAVLINDLSSGAAFDFVIKKTWGQPRKIGIGTPDPRSALDVVGLPIYANNAAAIAGGLLAGSLYRTNADPDLVCVVH